MRSRHEEANTSVCNINKKLGFDCAANRCLFPVYGCCSETVLNLIVQHVASLSFPSLAFPRLLAIAPFVNSELGMHGLIVWHHYY